MGKVTKPQKPADPKPCPFCECEEVIVAAFKVQCVACGARIGGETSYSLPAWNTRPAILAKEPTP